MQNDPFYVIIRDGHTTGDEVLRNVVQCFKKVIRSDDILGRYGGEEFAIFLPRTDLPTAIQIAERLRQKLIEWSLSGTEQHITVTASFGVYAVIPDQAMQIDTFLNTADQALYQAKEKGRNRVAW